MRRREFISTLAGAAAWPLAAHAQQPMPVVGFLLPTGWPEQSTRLAGFRKGLGEVGYVESQNVMIEYHRAEAHYDQFPGLANLIERRVSAIVPVGTPAALAAKAATTTIPIVFGIGGDPVAVGLVASLRRPGGNITGVVVLSSELAAKRLQLLHELLPATTDIAFLNNPANRSYTEPETKEVQDAARSLGMQLRVVGASIPSEIDTAFATVLRLRAGALIVSQELFLQNQRAQIVALAARHAVPAIYGSREDAVAGGLISYGADVADSYRQLGAYVGRILKGEKPTNLPVQQATKIEMIINLKTARTLGLTLPLPLLGRADEVIE